MVFSLSEFFVGEERVTTELLPFAIAAPTDDQRIFLASQIADEARHCVFFDRFYREVLGARGGDDRRQPRPRPAGTSTTSSRSSSTASSTTVADELRKDPRTSRPWSAGSPST